MEISKIKSSILQSIFNGEVSENILKILKEDEKFINKESHLWDYKERIDTTDKISIGEIVKDIVAFYNTFGGYLIIGVDDSGVVIGHQQIDEKSIKTNLYNYTGSDIEISCGHFNGVNVIHIPKRGNALVPVAISRIGPEKNKKSIFKPGEIYFRADDSSQTIRNDKDLTFLLSTREIGRSNIQNIIQNNLPEKSSIFQRFIGRDSYIFNLNEWLLDPFRKYMLLAGPGGVGKTSIAYSFCESLCTNRTLGFEQIVWISAKKEQYDAISNRNNPLPYNRDSRNFGQYYFDLNSLLDALSFHFPIIDEEWVEQDSGRKLQILLRYASSAKSFIVIDDLDSMSIDDQRNSINLAMQFGHTQNRFLFTTRKNFLAPQSNTLEVGGLKENDYYDLVESLCSNFNITISKSQKNRLERETNGSPLLTESIFRMLKLGDNFEEVLSRWKGKDGETARAKSFERELSQLSFNSKTLLYGTSLADSISRSELQKITELSSSELNESYVELEQLFLINLRSIGDQPRYSIPSTLKRTIKDLHDDLFAVFHEVNRRFVQLRQESKLSLTKGTDKEVGLTIQQAISQLSVGDYDGAVNTVESRIDEKSDNADLWMLYGRCLLGRNPIDVTKARFAFEQSYSHGKREFQLFDLWLGFEMQHGNSNSAIHVVKKGNIQSNNDNWQWQRAVSLAYFKRGSERAKRRDYSDAISDFEKSSRNIIKSLKNSHPSLKRELIEISQEINSSLIICFRKTVSIDYEEKFNILHSLISKGEKRELFYIEAIEIIRRFKEGDRSSNSKSLEMTEKIQNLYNSRAKTANIDFALLKITSNHSV